MLLDKIKSESNISLKSGDSFRVGVLRMLISAVNNQAISLYGADWESKLTDRDVLDVIKKQVKTHKESVTAYTAGNRADLVEKETKEQKILEEYLPPEISDQELELLLGPIAQTDEPNFGKLMGMAMKAAAGYADGNRVSQTLKKLISAKGAV
jgi:uncharacterized protein